MMNKEVYLKNVAESLALLSREVSILNAVNLYDINIVAEDFFPGLLNLIYGYELKNANYLEKNAPAIDLVDPKNRIAVQVTSDNSSTKIKHTIEEFNKNKGTNLIKTVAVHLEPMGIYSKKIKDLNELKDKAKVSIPNDPTNESRALDVLADAGLIELDSKVELKTPLDITKNPKNLNFVEIDAASVPRTLDDVDIAVINTNFALNAGFNPLKDALQLESKDSPYANIIAVKKGNENSEKIKALDEAITSQTVKDFIEKKYNGAILPAF